MTAVIGRGYFELTRESSSLWSTKFRLGKMKPTRNRQSGHQGQSMGQVQLASLKGYNQREHLASHQRVRDTSNIKCFGDGKENYILCFQDSRMWVDRIMHGTFLLKMSQGVRLVIKSRQEVNKGPNAAWTHDARYTVKANWIISQL